MSVWARLVLTGETDGISLFASAWLLGSTTECGIIPSIATYLTARHHPGKKKIKKSINIKDRSCPKGATDTANPPAAVLACIIGSNKQVWH